MTNRELKEFLGTLTEEQLDQDAQVWGEAENGFIEFAEVLNDDYINPSGEGAEAKSMYTNIHPLDPEYCGDMEDEPIVASKGQVKYYFIQK